MGFGEHRGEGVVPAGGALRRFDSENIVIGDEVDVRLDATVHRAKVEEDQLLPLTRGPAPVTVVCPEVCRLHLTRRAPIMSVECIYSVGGCGDMC
jgi:hypothetical protein